MTEYTPEIGQVLFGQPYQRFACPEWLEAFLWHIDRELKRVMQNLEQREWLSPFSNTGTRYQNDTFEVQAYSWGEEEAQEYNFRWEDVRISWYKYLGRGTTVNQSLPAERAIRMLRDCLSSLSKAEIDGMKERDYPTPF